MLFFGPARGGPGVCPTPGPGRRSGPGVMPNHPGVPGPEATRCCAPRGVPHPGTPVWWRCPGCAPPRGYKGRRAPGVCPTPGQNARGRCPGSPDLPPGPGRAGGGRRSLGNRHQKVITAAENRSAKQTWCGCGLEYGHDATYLSNPRRERQRVLALGLLLEHRVHLLDRTFRDLRLPPCWLRGPAQHRQLGETSSSSSHHNRTSTREATIGPYCEHPTRRHT